MKTLLQGMADQITAAEFMQVEKFLDQLAEEATERVERRAAAPSAEEKKATAPAGETTPETPPATGDQAG